ncbi:hypothetical protein QO019_006165 [Streptomyces thermodiastaticus]|uniref:Uncharacterized protein n=1 Tax=Streptomyces thermodiastaticus TaxID=44061 RepID=A0ABU0KPB0_9ACTN|nr:hypothetical protein [Streptomyces thermodiastaticus]
MLREEIPPHPPPPPAPKRRPKGPRYPRSSHSPGHQVLDRQDPSTSYGVVWHDPEVCQWVAEYPGNRPSSGGGIPEFASRKWAARFLYRYRKPQPSGRT